MRLCGRTGVQLLLNDTSRISIFIFPESSRRVDVHTVLYLGVVSMFNRNGVFVGVKGNSGGAPGLHTRDGKKEKGNLLIYICIYRERDSGFVYSERGSIVL